MKQLILLNGLRLLFLTGIPFLMTQKALSQTPCSNSSVIKQVKVNIHYVLKTDGSGNFAETSDGWGNSNYTGFDYAEDLVDSSNAELAVNPGIAGGMRIPGYDYTVTDFGFRFVLSGVYFHRSDAIYNYYDANYNNGALSGSINNWTYNNWLVNPATEINYFIFSVPSQPTMQLKGIANSSPGALQAKQFNNWYSYKYGAWGQTPAQIHRFEERTFTHELGHLLGLRHTWNQNDFCNDTKLNPNCWQFATEATLPCDSCGCWENITNNLMDYNGYDNYALSPQQIQRVRDYLNGTTGTNYVQQCSNCDAAQANLYLSPNQCLPVRLDGTASDNEDNHFLEIVEVDAANNMISGTYYSSWFAGEINQVADLGQYTGYNFIYGKRYRIKLAVQSINPAGGFCTPWDETPMQYVTIGTGSSCCAASLQLHTLYDINHECIDHFEAACNCPSESIDEVVFQIMNTTYTDDEYTYVYYPGAGTPFAGTVYATFHFNDGSTSAIHKTYQKCEIVTPPIEPGRYRSFEITENEGVEVFPNPSTGAFSIQNNSPFTQNIRVLSLDGRVIYELQVDADASSVIDLSGSANGTYIVDYSGENETMGQQKIVIQK